MTAPIPTSRITELEQELAAEKAKVADLLVVLSSSEQNADRWCAEKNDERTLREAAEARITTSRQEALEEAARVVEADADHWKPRPKDVAAMTPITALAHNLAAHILYGTAKSIRALATPTQPPQ